MGDFIFEREHNLPENWILVPLADLVYEVNSGFALGKHNPHGIGVPHLRPMNISSEGQIDLTEVKYVEVENDYDNLIEGDVLFNNTNSPELLGKTAFIQKNTDWAYSNHMTRLRFLPELIEPRWFAYYLNYLFKTGYFKLYATNHVNQSSISQHFLGTVPILFPPLNEQVRIIDEIEAQFSRLETWLETMEKLRIELPRLRASILKAAVEGRLVEQYPEDEPAEILLQRILEKRRLRWEEEYLAELEAGGKPIPKTDKWKEKYTEPEPPEIENLPDLPESWIWVSMPQLGELSRGKSAHRPRNDPALYDGVYPFVQTGDVRSANGVITIYSQTYNKKGLEQSRLWPAGTMCITIAANIADTAILGFDACFPDSIVGFLAESNACVVQFIEYYMRTVREEIDRTAPATAQKNINLQILRKLAIPYPPLSEQVRITERVNSTISVLDHLEESIKVNVKRAERMRQAVLKKAFEGRLVEQDANDEPASELLKRIEEERKRRAEQEAQSPKPRRERVMSKTTDERKSLYETLKEAGKPLTALELFQQAGFSHETIDEFYEELRYEIGNEGSIQSWRDKDDEVMLEVTG